MDYKELAIKYRFDPHTVDDVLQQIERFKLDSAGRGLSEEQIFIHVKNRLCGWKRNDPNFKKRKRSL